MTTKHIPISEKDQASTQVLTKQKGLVVPDTLGMSDRRGSAIDTNSS